MASRPPGAVRGVLGDSHDAVGDRAAEPAFRLVDPEFLGGDLEHAREAVDLGALVLLAAAGVRSGRRRC